MSWPMVKLKDCCEVVGGATPSREVAEYWNSLDVPWVTPKDISNLKNPILDDAPEYMSKAGFKNCATFMLPKGSVLVTSRAPIGNVAIAGRDMCTNQGFKSLIPGEDVDGLYLYYCMLAHSKRLQDLGNGATFKEVSKKIVEDFEIPLPPLSEQKRIAAILDKADAIRRKRQQAIQLADEFLRAVFLDMFGDFSNKGWSVITVGDIAINKKGGMRTGPFGSQLLHSEFVDQGVSVLGIDNVVENKFKWGKPRFITQEKYGDLKKYTVFPGDVLISIMGTCGRCAIVPDDIPTSINTKHLCCISLDRSKCLPEYLHAYFLFHDLAKKYLEATTKGAIMDGLNMGLIRDMPIPLPPIDMQWSYSKIKRKHEALLVGMFNHKKSTLFESVSAAAFEGKI